MGTIPEGWRALSSRQIPRKDFPLREILMTVFLIIVVWLADVLLVRPAYDRDYFIVQKTIRAAKAHCRDMVIDRRKPGLFEVHTCGKLRLYKVVGDTAVMVDEKPDPKESCPR